MENWQKSVYLFTKSCNCRAINATVSSQSISTHVNHLHSLPSRSEVLKQHGQSRGLSLTLQIYKLQRLNATLVYFNMFLYYTYITLRCSRHFLIIPLCCAWGKKPPARFFALLGLKINWAKPFYDFFFNIKWAQNAIIRSSISTPEIVRPKHDDKHIILCRNCMAKYNAHVD